MTTTNIEVYEWKEGAPRPGTTEKHRHTCIDILEIPPGGQLPGIGDLVLFTDPLSDDPSPSTRYRVLEREFLWGRMPSDAPGAPQRWSKMWIHVRRLEDQTK